MGKPTTYEVFMVIAICLLGIGLIFLGLKPFFFKEDKVITFNVTGITNSTNATTLVQLHFECIKFCTGRDYQTDCYKQCALLGTEECK